MAETRTSIRLKERDIAIAYALLRIVTGVNYFNHGFTRLGNILGFVDGMVQQFQNSFIPEVLVRIGAFIVSPLELIAGFLITVGLLTRGALIATFGLMIMLMYGVTAIQQWDTASSQLIYCIVLFLLLACHAFNKLSIDSLIRRRQIPKIATPDRQTVARFANNFSAKRRQRKPFADYR